MDDKVLEFVVEGLSHTDAGDVWEDLGVFTTPMEAEAYLDDLCSESDGCDYRVISRARATTNGDSDEGQFDIVCEGHTENGMKFQIVTDNQNKDKGYGFAVDIRPCFNEDYTQYQWGYPTLYSVFEEIESTYSADYEKCKFLKPGRHALVRLHGKMDSDLIFVSSCCDNSVTYTVAGSYDYQTSKLKDLVVLHAVITLWSDECLESHVGCVFRRIGNNTTQLAVGTYSAYDTIYLNLSGKDYYSGKRAKELAEFYEVKTEEGWKPCYNVNWEE